MKLGFGKKKDQINGAVVGGAPGSRRGRLGKVAIFFVLLIALTGVALLYGHKLQKKDSKAIGDCKDHFTKNQLLKMSTTIENSDIGGMQSLQADLEKSCPNYKTDNDYAYFSTIYYTKQGDYKAAYEWVEHLPDTINSETYKVGEYLAPRSKKALRLDIDAVKLASESLEKNLDVDSKLYAPEPQ